MKKCPQCGSDLKDNDHFCQVCGFNLQQTSKTNTVNRIIFALIVVIFVVGVASIAFTPDTSNLISNQEDAHVGDGFSVTLTGINGYSNSGNKTTYTYYVTGYIKGVPSDYKDYLVKTTYYDKNNSVLGTKTDSLSAVYYDADYDLSFCFYTSYNRLDVDHAVVEFTKDGKTYENYTISADPNKLNF